MSNDNRVNELYNFEQELVKKYFSYSILEMSMEEEEFFKSQDVQRLNSKDAAKYLTLAPEGYRNKAEILEGIQEIRQLANEKLESKLNHSHEFYISFMNILDKFEKGIQKLELFEAPTENAWFYEIDGDTSGLELRLSLMYYDLHQNGMVDSDCDECYTMFKTDANLLSIEEFADLHGVQPGSVRQWIRRGKIRDAVKLGSEWGIPELSEVSGKGYTNVSYYWKKDSITPPEHLDYLVTYNHILIEQNVSNKDRFNITFSDDNGSRKKEEFKTKEKERLELYLLSTNNVETHYSKFFLSDLYK